MVQQEAVRLLPLVTWTHGHTHTLSYRSHFVWNTFIFSRNEYHFSFWYFLMYRYYLWTIVMLCSKLAINKIQEDRIYIPLFPFRG